MSALEQIVLAFQSLSHAFREIFRPSLWVPWLAVLAVQLMVIGSLWWFAHPAVSWLIAPILERLAGESALRYPNIFRLMPELYARADVLVAILVGAIAGGASTTLFAAVFAGQPLLPGQGLRRALSRALPLVLANLPLSLLLLGFSFGLEWWLAERGGPALIARLAPILTIGLAVMLQALFLWVNPLLMLGRYGLIETLTSLPRAASHGAWAALTMAAAATIPLLPVQMLAHGSSRIVSHGTPEMVGWLVLMQALIAIVTAFVLTGGSVLAYQSLVGPALEEEL